jgi:hypothetical protein
MFARPLDEAQVRLLATFLWQTVALPACGEFGLNAMLAFPDNDVEALCVARRPLAPRLLLLAKAHAESGGPGFRVLLTYGGSYDFMRTATGNRLACDLAACGGLFSASEGVHLPASGHQVYLESPYLWNALHARHLEEVVHEKGWAHMTA